ncbi:hypothetical protein ACFO5R_04545 [Halosolutus amylolyticus]|uniref:Uncharacterized protein n=1 Tax=Halosolutus amylolyticus TaxID=2932267 RepID=A0ABD5PKY8_9EURY|nr:hypothetical protein [Halosolutus amylolyticus]
MSPRPRRAVASAITIATLGGLAHAAVVSTLLTRIDYPLVDSTAGLAALAAGAFLLGFVAFLVTAHTRLYFSAIGSVALLVGVTYVELTSPDPQTVGELGGHDIVEGPFHVYHYADNWALLLSLLLVAGVAEYGLRRGYGPGADRLRNLPDLPLRRRTLAGVVVGVAGFVGVATVLLVQKSATLGVDGALVVFACVAAVTAVPLAALLGEGALVPLFLFTLVVPRFLLVEVFLTTDSYVHILALGLYAIVLAIVGLLETRFRARYRGWDGGAFTEHTNPE